MTTEKSILPGIIHIEKCPIGTYLMTDRRLLTTGPTHADQQLHTYKHVLEWPVKETIEG